MRVLGADETELELVDVDVPGTACVAVPGLGWLVVVLEGAVDCLVTQGPGTERRRPVQHVDRTTCSR